MNKREFMWAAGGSALAGCGGSALAASSAIGPTASASRAPLATLAGWREQVGNRFEVFGSDGSAIELRSVQAHEAAAGTEQFTLVFSVIGVALAAGTQVLQPAGRHPLALYLDAAGQADSGAGLLRADCCRLI